MKFPSHFDCFKTVKREITLFLRVCNAGRVFVASSKDEVAMALKGEVRVPLDRA